LHASALSLPRKHLTAENAAALFELSAHRSARKVEELLAARFPKPDVRDLVRRLSAQVGPTLDVGCASKRMPTEATPGERSAPRQEMPRRMGGAAARRCLELDHVKPRAVSGLDTVDNFGCVAELTISNTRLFFGKVRVEAAVQRAQRRRGRCASAK